jgi:hypothetical protein
MRASVAISMGILAALITCALAFGLGASSIGVAVAAAVSVGVGQIWWRWTHPITWLDETATSRGLKRVSAVATLAALVMLGRLTVFMLDPGRPQYSFVPGSQWEVHHSCLTAYHVAARTVDAGGDPFDPRVYTSPEDDGKSQRKPLRLGAFNVDVYEYPPPFLLLPRALQSVAPDFERLRSLWFGLNLGTMLAAIGLVVHRLGPATRTRAFLLSPLVLAAPCTIGLLQKGNVQGLIVAIAMIAMVLLESRRPAANAAGGALLAFATVSKLYPGLLVFYLLVRRRWVALGWTAAFGLVYVLATLAYAGTAPFVSFVHHLPGLLGGEAFPAFRNPFAMAGNYSVPGIAFKAGILGVPGMGFGVSKVIGWVWTLVILWLIARIGRRMLCAEEEPLVWLAVIVVATLRSPFLPQAYAGVPPIWLLTLVAAAFAPSARTLAITLACWLPMAVIWPNDWRFVDVRLVLLLGLVPSALLIALPVRTLWRARAPGRPALPEAEPARSPAA